MQDGDIPGRLAVLILGGYGTFGGRLARLLADEPRLTLLIAGRSQARAEAFCETLDGAADIVPLALDRTGDLEAAFAHLAPDLVVDASGPFQNYGPAPYGVVEACLARGISYLDLADGSDFVTGIARFDEAARARGIAVLSGASSFPVLTLAAAEALSADLAEVESITGGVAPSPYAGVGENVIRAIAGYAGQPIELTRGGRQATGHALTEAMDFTIAPPGRMPLRTTRFSLVDVPDLRVLAERWPGVSSVWMGAGPVPEILHRALNGLAWLVRLRLLPSLLWLAPVFARAINVVRWGEHRGGMFVRVVGRTADGTRAERTWHLLAEGEDGPLIPSMAVEGIVRKMLAGDRPRSGARAASGELNLDNYDRLFARRTIVTGRRETPPAETKLSLYHHLLGEAWAELPPEIQAMHLPARARRASGRAEIERGRSILARLVGAVMGFPKAGRDVPVTVSFEIDEHREVWRRDFAGRVFESVQSAGRGRREWLLCERFGAVTVALALVVEGGRLTLVPRHAAFLGRPLPRFMMPGGHGTESVQGGRFRFDVEIAHPWIGSIVRYRGWLAIEEAA